MLRGRAEDSYPPDWENATDRLDLGYCLTARTKDTQHRSVLVCEIFGSDTARCPSSQRAQSERLHDRAQIACFLPIEVKSAPRALAKHRATGNFDPVISAVRKNPRSNTQ